MDTIERTYTIPLRKQTKRTQPKKRARKAISAIRLFIGRHMHVSDVSIGNHLNELVWSRGIENPPHKVTVSVRKTEGKAFVNLVGKSLEPQKVELIEKKKDKSILEKQMEKITGKDQKTTPAQTTSEVTPAKDEPSPDETDKKKTATNKVKKQE